MKRCSAAAQMVSIVFSVVVSIMFCVSSTDCRSELPVSFLADVPRVHAGVAGWAATRFCTSRVKYVFSHVRGGSFVVSWLEVWLDSGRKVYRDLTDSGCMQAIRKTPCVVRGGVRVRVIKRQRKCRRGYAASFGVVSSGRRSEGVASTRQLQRGT